MDSRDSICLYKIKNKYGGAIKFRSGSNSIRYRLHHKEGLIKLIHDVNGEIRNPNRILQLKKICTLYHINLIPPLPLTIKNNWFSGFFDADGTITINRYNLQLSLSISQKDPRLLEKLPSLFLGKVYIDRNSKTYKWYISKKEDILKLIDYFKEFPCYSEKKNHIYLIYEFYELQNLSNNKDLINTFLKKWKNFDN